MMTTKEIFNTQKKLFFFTFHSFFFSIFLLEIILFINNIIIYFSPSRFTVVAISNTNQNRIHCMCWVYVREISICCVCICVAPCTYIMHLGFDCFFSGFPATRVCCWRMKYSGSIYTIWEQLLLIFAEHFLVIGFREAVVHFTQNWLILHILDFLFFTFLVFLTFKEVIFEYLIILRFRLDWRLIIAACWISPRAHAAATFRFSLTI